MFAGINSLYLFKPNVGIQCDYGKGGYTTVTTNASSIVATPTNNTQYQWFIFNINLTEYIGKEKKVRITYKVSSSEVSECILTGTESYNSTIKANGYNLEKTTSLKTIEIPLDSIINSSKPFLGVRWIKEGLSVSFTVTELAIC